MTVEEKRKYERERKRRWIQENPERYREYQREYKRKLRAKQKEQDEEVRKG